MELQQAYPGVGMGCKHYAKRMTRLSEAAHLPGLCGSARRGSREDSRLGKLPPLAAPT
jgi:hypothetical protein